MFVFTVTVQGVKARLAAAASDFGTVDLSKVVVLGTYAKGGKSGSVITDGNRIALNPDTVATRGSKVISAEPNKLPDSGKWGLVDGYWDLIAAEPTKAEEPKATAESQNPEDTF